jgi:hypothetical protein
MKKMITPQKKWLYESPITEEVFLAQERHFCGTNGETQNYDHQDPWNIPDND